jgi:TolB-like protein/class 3 adenylate cyclase/Flp pilus assembly protein TadD
MERRLAAILAADVVGYSRLMGEDEAGTLAALKAHREALIDPKIVEHQGRIVKTTGDGMLVEFPSVVEAVQCAVEIQNGMGERNAASPENRRMLLRIGINIGDVIIEGDDIYGDGVNVAARLESLAEPGGICVRRVVRNQVRDKLPVVFQDMGEIEVKNIARPLHAFRVVLEAKVLKRPVLPAEKQPTARKWLIVAVAAVALVALAVEAVRLFRPWTADVGPAVVERTEALPRSDKPVIAVLPFTNLSDDLKQEYFSDGITTDIITDLSNFSELHVIASNSVFTYKGRAVKVQEVRRDLGAGYVLEGSVQRAGSRIRVNAQLIDAASGQHLWAERYDEDIKSLFDLQDEITRQIVGTLAVKLTRLEQERAFSKPTSNLRAYDYVLRGREYLQRATRKDTRGARRLLQRAIELDPDYALAYVALGWTHMHDYWFGWSEFPDRTLQQAYDLARKALSLDETVAAAHGLLGAVYLNQLEYERATDELDRAIELSPNDVQSHADRGRVMVWSGRPDKAVEALETVQKYDPNMGPTNAMNLGLAYYLQGRYDDAIGTLEHSLVKNPDYVFGHNVLAAAYAQAGRSEDAARTAQTVRRLQPFFEVESYGTMLRDSSHRERIAAGLRRAGLQ